MAKCLGAFKNNDFPSLLVIGLIFLGIGVQVGRTWDRGSSSFTDNDFNFWNNEGLPPTCPKSIAECGHHTDCPDNKACYTDYKCRDVCISSEHGLQCVLNARCQVINHEPNCVCNPGFQGDGLVRCAFRSVVTEATTPTYIPGKRRCTKHSDCPDHLTCFVDGDCKDVCVHSMHRLNCTRNSVCEVVNHQARCSLPRF